MSKHPTILLVGNQLDSHVKLVSEDIVRMGGTPIVLSMEDASTWLGHSVECDEGGVQTYDTTSKSIIDVTAVWWRRYCKAETAGIPSDAKLPGEEARVFCRGQRHQHFLGAICALPSIVEVNPLWAEWRISTKAVQLRMARDIGFAIPRTYMGADPIAARAFAESCLTSGSAVVSKAHTSVPLPSITHDGRDYGRMTTLLHPERLGELNDLHGTPVILQEYVPKAFEVRATVVGDRVFACGIDSQKSDRTKVDWRRYDLPNTPHWPYDMPKDVERKLLEFCRRAELVFGAFDLIVRPDGEHVFLEVNPSGQWLWIEELVGLPISEHLAKVLLGRAPRCMPVSMHEADAVYGNSSAIEIAKGAIG